MQYLLNGVTANGSGPKVRNFKGSPKKITLLAHGIFDSATITVQVLNTDDGAHETGISFTDATAVEVWLDAVNLEVNGNGLQATVAGATANTDVSLECY